MARTKIAQTPHSLKVERSSAPAARCLDAVTRTLVVLFALWLAPEQMLALTEGNPSNE